MTGRSYGVGHSGSCQPVTWDRVAARMSNRYAGLLAADRQPDWVNHAGVKEFQDS
jgi:hypothetical protein